MRPLIYDHGANTFVGKYLQQERVESPTVDNVSTRDTAFQGPDACFDLRNHTPGDMTSLDQLSGKLHL